MTLLDVNVLFALSWPEHVHHGIAHDHFSHLTSWSTTPVTEAGLTRLLLTEAVTGRKVNGHEALQHLASIRQAPGWRWLEDECSLVTPAIDVRVLMGRRQVTDLQLVNLAAHNNTRLATFDAGIRNCLAPLDQQWVDVWR